MPSNCTLSHLALLAQGQGVREELSGCFADFSVKSHREALLLSQCCDLQPSHREGTDLVLPLHPQKSLREKETGKELIS